MKYIKSFELYESDSNKYEWMNHIDEIQKDFLSNIKTIKRDIYHGTSASNVVKIVKNGPQPGNHRELQMLLLSTSTNSNIFRFFGDGSGFEFYDVTMRVVVMPDFYYDLLSYETGMESEWREDSSSEEYQKALRMGFMSRWGSLGIENGEKFEREVFDTHPILKSISGFFLFENHQQNSEDEIALTMFGANEIFKNEDYTVRFDGSTYTKEEFADWMENNPDEVIEYLNMPSDEDY